MKTEDYHHHHSSFYHELLNSIKSGQRTTTTALSSYTSCSTVHLYQMCSLADHATNYNHHPGSNRKSCNFSVRNSSSSSSAGAQRDIHNHHHNFFYDVSSCSYSSASKHQTVLLVCYVLAFLLVSSSIPGTAGIDCFKCVSLNGDNPSCEDPFHNNYSVSIYEAPCMGGRKGRNGLFPATACIKLAGKYYETGETITVRGCALDSGTLNVDTEIIRMSHCGHFWFDDRYVKGCLQSCDDADGCNGSSRPSNHFTVTASIITTTLLLFLIGTISSTGLPAYFSDTLPNNLAVHRPRRFHRHCGSSSSSAGIEVL